MQTRLLNPKPQQIEALAGHARFRAGFDFLLLREKSGDDTTQGMGSWWEAYQEMSNDEKEAAISQYNRQKARNRRKAVAEPVENNKVETEIEPLVDIPEPRSRRGKKERARQEQSMGRFVEKASASEAGVMSDHPILKRKRVQRDLSQVIFGPTQ
jgi:poly(A) polymerase